MTRGFKPSKGKGQNFLVDGNLARKFVALLAPTPEDWVLEVGPGKGALTEPLLATGCRVRAIEVEAALADELEAKGLERLELVRGDFLDLPDEALAPPDGAPGLALSNVPYSVTGPVLVRLLQGAVPLRRIVVGVQREVADRLAAKPGTKDFGSLSVMARAFGTARRGFKISPNAYRPRPKVDSAAVLLERDPDSPLMAAGSPLERVVRASFSQRRKTIANSLSGGLGVEKAQALAWLEAAGMDPGRRAETFGLSDYRALSEAYQAG